jgi:hypothetical protein
MRKNIALGAILLAGAMLTGLAGCSREAPVSYARDVQPILQANCLRCHQTGGPGFEASGFSMMTYDDLMKGTKFGPMIVPGDSAASNLLVLMEGRADPSISMPHDRAEPVAKADIDKIRLWIDQGAKKN